MPDTIEYLDLSNTTVTDKQLSDLAPRLTKLKKITLLDCRNLQVADIILSEVPNVVFVKKGW